MCKNDKCEWCGETLIPGCFVFEYEGQVLRFCEKDCFDDWLYTKLQPFMHYDSEVEEEYED